MTRDAKLAAALTALFLLPLLAACNLNVSPGPSVQEISGPPVVQILAPIANSTYLEGVAVNIQLQVQNAGTDLARVDFSVDGQGFDSLANPNSDGAAMFTISSSWTAAGPGAHVLSVVAVRNDGSSSAPASVTVTVIGQSPSSGAGGDSERMSGNGGAAGPQEDEGPQDTAPAEPTTASEPPSDQPMGRVLRGAYVRRGPDTRFAPPIGSIGAGDQVELVAINFHETWYKIKYYNGEGWVFASLLEVSGNVEDLPQLWGPPLPQPTAIPPTAAPPVVDPGNVNLVAGEMRHTGGGGRITCRVGFSVEIDVANTGTSRSPGGSVRFVDYATKADGGRLDGTEAVEIASFPPIDPGRTIGVSTRMTINFHYKERHVLWAYINHDGAVPEANRADNNGHFTYVLEQGDCGQ